MSGTAKMLKAQQVRAGRVLVGVGQKELAEMAGIAVATLRRMEDDGIGPERSNAGSVQRVKDDKQTSLTVVPASLPFQAHRGPDVRFHQKDE